MRPWLLFIVWLCLVTPLGVAHGQHQQAPPSENDVYADDSAFSDDDFDDDFYDDEEFSDDPQLIVNDPLESINRGIFWFNDKLYFYALKPVARAYRVVPEPARKSVSNFFSNLTTPIRMTNALLQGKFHDAASELTRFIFNTTIGLGGLFDPADKLAGVRKKEEDFGQTLGHYGVGTGVYIVLPFFGPSTARDSVGLIVDSLADPVNNLLENDEYIAATAANFVNTISLDKNTYETIKRDAFDPYLFIRDAYLHNRQRKVEQ